MLRKICFLFALLFSQLVFSQDVEVPNAETVSELYHAHGVPFKGVDTGRSALLIFSAGCAQCVELATLHKEELVSLVTEQGFNTRFVEMPGAVAQPEEVDITNGEQSEFLNVARVTANSASMILECSDATSGEDAISLIADLGRAARLMSGTEPDPERLLTTDWANWPYLSSFNDAGQYQSIAAGVLQMVVGARNIDLERCDQDAAWERLGIRHEAILKSGITYVPGLYLLPDETYPRMMVWDYDDLIELVEGQ